MKHYKNINRVVISDCYHCICAGEFLSGGLPYEGLSAWMLSSRSLGENTCVSEFTTITYEYGG